MKGIVSSTYMSFIGLRLSIKGGLCFIELWYILRFGYGDYCKCTV